MGRGRDRVGAGVEMIVVLELHPVSPDQARELAEYFRLALDDDGWTHRAFEGARYALHTDATVSVHWPPSEEHPQGMILEDIPFEALTGGVR